VSLGLLCTFSRMRALLKLADGTKEDKVQLARRFTSCAAVARRCVLLMYPSIIAPFFVSSGPHGLRKSRYMHALESSTPAAPRRMLLQQRRLAVRSVVAVAHVTHHMPSS